MVLRKLLFSSLIVSLFTFTTAQAQKPDTVSLKVKNSRFYKAIVKTTDGDKEEGFMIYHFPYSPDAEVSLIPLDGNQKNTEVYKVKHLESIDYADLRYVKILPDNDDYAYLAREATKGALTLYTYTEGVKAEKVKGQEIAPGASAIRSAAIPFDQSLFFIKKGSGVKLINKNKFQEQMLKYVGSNAALAEKIKNNTYQYKDIETIVKEYNASVVKP